MADTSVSSSVLSIIASFTSGREVWRKVRKRRDKHRRKRREGKAAVETEGSETRLARSLRQGPEDIGREYQAMGIQGGSHFAMGDATAQTSLAEILLKLNTGLVGIITSFLSRDRSDCLDLDYYSLTELSECSRFETVGVLRQLFQRLLSRKTLARLSPAQKHDRSEERGAIAPTDDHIPKKHTKVRGPTLARVVVQNSSKPSQLAIVRPSDTTKKSRSSSRSRSGPADKQPKPSAAANSSLSLPPTLTSQSTDPPNPLPPNHQRSKTAPALPKPHSRPELRYKPPPVYQPQAPKPPRHSRSTPRLPPTYEALYSQPSPPLPSPKPAPEYRHRKETPTFYSSATGSTKLGEIPMHKWPKQFDWDAASAGNREALASGWPVLVDVGVAEGKQKGRGFFGLFRRRERVGG